MIKILDNVNLVSVEQSINSVVVILVLSLCISFDRINISVSWVIIKLKKVILLEKINIMMVGVLVVYYVINVVSNSLIVIQLYICVIQVCRLDCVCIIELDCGNLFMMNFCVEMIF